VELLAGENQSVWIAVAGEATIKAIKHCLAMGQSVTFLTFRDVAVSVVVTVCALKVGVFFCGTGQMFNGFFMAAGTG
jgi:hypothetical protein